MLRSRPRRDSIGNRDQLADVGLAVRDGLNGTVSHVSGKNSAQTPRSQAADRAARDGGHDRELIPREDLAWLDSRAPEDRCSDAAPAMERDTSL